MTRRPPPLPPCLIIVRYEKGWVDGCLELKKSGTREVERVLVGGKQRVTNFLVEEEVYAWNFLGCRVHQSTDWLAGGLLATRGKKISIKTTKWKRKIGRERGKHLKDMTNSRVCLRFMKFRKISPMGADVVLGKILLCVALYDLL